MTDIHGDKILILDFGAQYTQLIARRIREIGVYCEIWAWDHDPAEIAAFGAKGIILSGGPESTTQPDSPRAPQVVFDSGVPVLGICYGMQTMAAQLGGRVEGGHHREFGYAEVEVSAACALLDGLKDHAGSPPRLDVWMSHGDRVTALPTGFHTTATDLLDGVAEGLRSERKKYRPITLVTRQGAIEGLETTFTIVGNRIRYEAYVLERGAARSLLMLQDSTDGAAAASEFKDMRQRLGATLEF